MLCACCHHSSLPYRYLKCKLHTDSRRLHCARYFRPGGSAKPEAAAAACASRCSGFAASFSVDDDWLTSSSSRLRSQHSFPVVVLLRVPTSSKQTPSHLDAHCSPDADPRSLLNLAPRTVVSVMCIISYHRELSSYRLFACSSRIPHTIPPCCVDTGTARPLPDTTMASIRIGLSSLNSHFACIPSYHTLSHESCRILSSQGPLPRPSFPRSRPSTPSSPHTHNQHVYPSRRHTSERPLTFSHVSFSLSLCVPDFICCSITFFFSFSFFLAFSTFCF